MFPKWFDKWQNDNPTNIFGPAIAIGIVGSAVFVAAMLIAWGQPYATAGQQTGPRGTGMSVQEFVSDLEAGDPTVADFYTDEPFVPEPGEERAGDIYENVQVLGDLTDANFNRLMNALTLWVAPDEGCVYCHAGAADGNYADDDLYTKVVARNMILMTQNLNVNWDAHVNANYEVGVTCYTCHRGQPVPNNVWFRVGEVNSNAGGWPAIQNRATMTSNFTSLPSTYLEHFLLQDEDGFYGVAQVHDLESRAPNPPGSPLIQQAEMTYAWMNYFSNSLGVNCVFCHNSRAFYDGAQNTPQWGTASLGIIMVQEMIEEYLLPLEPVYPENRLGPVFGDAPLAACRTCHQGYQQPLNGLNAIQNWPELAYLASEGEVPDYSAFMTPEQIEAMEAALAAPEEAPVEEDAAAAEDEAPVEDEAAVEAEAPAEEEAAVADEAPAEDAAPAEEEAIVEEDAAAAAEEQEGATEEGAAIPAEDAAADETAAQEDEVIAEDDVATTEEGAAAAATEGEEVAEGEAASVTEGEEAAEGDAAAITQGEGVTEGDAAAVTEGEVEAAPEAGEEAVAAEDTAPTGDGAVALSQEEEMMLAICQAGEAAGVPLTDECMALIEAKAD